MFWLSSADNLLADHLSRGREREFLEDVMRTGFWHSSVTEDPYVQRHPEAGSLRTYASLADSACIQANVTAENPAPDGVYGPGLLFTRTSQTLVLRAPLRLSR